MTGGLHLLYLHPQLIGATIVMAGLRWRGGVTLLAVRGMRDTDNLRSRSPLFEVGMRGHVHCTLVTPVIIIMK
ncbi:hypothetical protein AGDE_16209 [Angomonas deanei]|nr:hypothetical protein AGDE_16209 [Angomonas deanei]|eukprot:EPY17520.1 hypothetical protein AGDE_16209 [Angomonas deanei]